MTLLKSRKDIHVLLCIGLLWGLVEAALAPVLKAHPSQIGGSVFAGLAFLFISCAYAYRSRFGSLFAILVVAAILKFISAAFAGKQIVHGSIINPVYAFATQAVFFYLVVYFMQKTKLGFLSCSVITGLIASALVCAAFPLVSYVTANPACIRTGTNVPLAIYYAYLTVGLAVFCVPAGMWIGRKVKGVLVASEKGHVPLLISLEGAAAIAFIAVVFSNV